MDKVLPCNLWIMDSNPTRVRTMIPHNYDTSTGWFQETDSKVIQISCENLLHKRGNINKLKLTKFNSIKIHQQTSKYNKVVQSLNQWTLMCIF